VIQTLTPTHALLGTLLLLPGVGQRAIALLLEYLRSRQVELREWWSQPHRCEVSEGTVLLDKIYEGRLHTKLDPDLLYEKWLRLGLWAVMEDDSEYPPALRSCSDHPIILFGQGSSEFSRQSVAVVGTRTITPYGQLATKKIVSGLIPACAIVSGFMVGVDVTAHRAALAAGGHTVGVLGYGHEHIYPPSLRKFRAEFLEQGGTLISEYSPPLSPLARQFPVRNRLIAGLSQAVIVVEAAERSGSHITVEWALQYGRHVMAVPGPLTSRFSEGTKYLVNQGATLVTSAQDVLSHLSLSQPVATSLAPDSPSPEPLLQYLESGPLSTDSLTTLSKVSLAELLGTLTEYELAGKVAKVGDTWYLVS
jgi:DNA processing protein